MLFVLDMRTVGDIDGKRLKDTEGLLEAVSLFVLVGKSVREVLEESDALALAEFEFVLDPEALSDTVNSTVPDAVRLTCALDVELSDTIVLPDDDMLLELELLMLQLKVTLAEAFMLNDFVGIGDREVDGVPE